MIQHKNVVETTTQASLSLTVSEDNSKTKRKHIGRHSGMTPRGKVEKKENYSPSNFSTQWEADPEYTSSKFTFSEPGQSDFDTIDDGKGDRQDLRKLLKL